MEEIAVSVCMISFNHENYIRKALESVCSQKTTFRFEIIIGDDKSEDGTPQIIEEFVQNYPNLITAILRDKNLGCTLNSYDVKKKAKGKYIATLEGDDYWCDEYKLQKQFDFLEKNQEIYSVAHRNLIINKEGEIVGKSHENIKLNRLFSKKDAICYQAKLFHPSSVMYRNFYLDNPEEAEKLEKLKTIGGHSLLIYYLASKSDIYIFEEAMSAWRCVAEEGGTNFQSVSMRKPISTQLSVLTMYCNYRSYFGKTYNFNGIICQKLFELILMLYHKREKEIEPLLYFYKNVLPIIHVGDIIRLPVIFLNRGGKKILRSVKRVLNEKF